jgi:hypothetical protein
MPERDGDPIFQSAVSGNHQFCITVACSNSASDHTARGRRPDTGSPGGISGSAAGTGAAAICAPYRGGRFPSCRISATKRFVRRGLLPQQRRQLRPPTRAGCRSTGRCHRPMLRRQIQLQPTSAGYLFGPWWRRPMAITADGYNHRHWQISSTQYRQRSTSIARACTRNLPPGTASRCLRRAFASSGSVVSTMISQLRP